MSTEAVQRARRAEFEKDLGRCVYCGGYAYAMPHNWAKHILNDHPDTIRAANLREVLAAAEKKAEEDLG